MTLQENKGKCFIYIIPFVLIIGIVYLMLYRDDGLDESLLGTSTSEEIITEQSDKVAIEEAAAPIAKEINKENKQKIVMNTLEEGKTYTTESGLQYEVMTLGTGATPQSPTDVVEVHYHGTLENGTVFDSSVERDEKISFPLDRVISGWTEGLQLMPVGSKFKFTIPANLAYGESSPSPAIPAGSTLIFEVELFGIK